MPKSQGINYDVHPSPNRDESGRPILYVRPVSLRKVTMQDLDDYCSQNCSLPRGELLRVFTAFQEAAKWFLSYGERVETPIGTFAPKLRMVRDETDASKVTASDILFDTVTFTPSKSFLDAVGERVTGFAKSENNCGNQQMYDRERMLRVLQACLSAGDGMITVHRFQQASGLRYHSARKCLDDFCGGESPVLRRNRIGRSYVYAPL